MTLSDFEKLFKAGTKIHGVFSVLKDQQWHCRECEYQHLNIIQIAGGGGIQGLQRGSGERPGMEIDSENHFCRNCEKQTRHDKWKGQFVSAIQSSGMSSEFVRRAVSLLGGKDIIEGTERPVNQLTLDHKLPMLRWDQSTQDRQTAYAEMSDSDIKRNFQLLKKSNGSVSHNLLKSRACEKCFKKGTRGTPFGIKFYYRGGPKWQGETKRDPGGCIGCGWFDFDEWRKTLNRKLK
ncbi:MAG: restriction endonuclease [Ectothiorhodospiraceae bacterium AqS1]|nr:restriction endonuclease [Ectothiorhodospiraceae bacterium AqS1]